MTSNPSVIELTTPKPSMLDAALCYASKGWAVSPLCYPTEDHQCGCFLKHKGNNIGKAPLTPHGIRDATTDPDQIKAWWKKWPKANIAIGLKEAGLLVVAPDSTDALDAFKEKGLTTTFVVQSGGGAGHYHFYYRKPDGCPNYRINRPGEYDIQSDGYMVAPPSLHQSGRHYQWIDPSDATLPDAPAWAQLLIWEAASKTPKTPPNWNTNPKVDIDLNNLDAEAKLWWDGTKSAIASNGEIDRSYTLFTIGRLLAQQGFDGPSISNALADRDVALGYNKYSIRKDHGSRAYSDIALKVTSPSTRQPKDSQRSAPKAHYTPPPEPQNPRLSQYHTNVGIPGHEVKSVLLESLEVQREVLTNYYKKRGSLEALRMADRVEHCFNYYIELVCQKTQIAFVRRFKCGDINCSLCALALLESFFKEKMEVLEACLKTPVVYRIYLGPVDLLSEEGPRDAAIRAFYKRIGRIMTRLRDNLGKTVDIATTNCRGLRCSLKSDTLHPELVLMGNFAPDTVSILETFFRRQISDKAEVFELPCVNLQHAIEIFRSLMAVRVVWDIPRDYEIWRGATKGMKLVQGRGGLYRVTGSTPTPLSPQEIAHLRLDCDVCSDCHPLVRDGSFHMVKRTHLQQKHSPWNGRTYSIIVEGGGLSPGKSNG